MWVLIKTLDIIRDNPLIQQTRTLKHREGKSSLRSCTEGSGRSLPSRALSPVPPLHRNNQLNLALSRNYVRVHRYVLGEKMNEDNFNLKKRTKERLKDILQNCLWMLIKTRVLIRVPFWRLRCELNWAHEILSGWAGCDMAKNRWVNSSLHSQARILSWKGFHQGRKPFDPNSGAMVIRQVSECTGSFLGLCYCRVGSDQHTFCSTGDRS